MFGVDISAIAAQISVRDNSGPEVIFRYRDRAGQLLRMFHRNRVSKDCYRVSVRGYFTSSRRGTTMASRTVLVLTDDTDGSEAQVTVNFGLDGTQYEIDLSEANAKKLTGALAPMDASCTEDRRTCRAAS